MDLRRLRHFDVLARTLNFSRAAERLHIAQPALSVSIQKLETELGARLFERTPSGVRLTAAGQSVLVEARRVLYHGEQMMRSARDAASGAGGLLRIGFVGSSIYRIVPRLIPRYRADYPDVELQLREATSAAIVSMLVEEALDLGVVRTPLLHAPAVSLVTLQRDRLIVAVPAGSRFDEPGELALAELTGEPFIMYTGTDAAGLRAHVMAACTAAGFAPVIAQEAIQVPTVLALVESGLGVALVPEVARGLRAPQVAYRDLREADRSESTLALASVPGNETPAARRCIEVARALFGEI